MRNDIARVLRKAAADCDLSGLQIARKTGVPQASISRFLAGGDIYLASAAKLAKFLRLELVPKTGTGKRKPSR